VNDAIGEGTITRLLTEQAPRLADLPLTFVRDGWDNTIWRLGDRLAVRVTRRVVAVDLHLHEQRWLPGLSAMLPLPVPAPVIAGAPSVHHPWPWSVVPWFDGDVAATAAPAPSEAAVLGAFLSALHTAAPAAAAANPARGGPMASHRAALMTWAEQAAATPPVVASEPCHELDPLDQKPSALQG
jgi:aminoglycoside phosphotransferase (APT) family kinase protein